MVKIIRKIEPAGGSPAEINNQVIEANERNAKKAKSKLSPFQQFIILTVISHDFVKQNASEFADQLDQFSNSLNGGSGPTTLAVKYGYNTGELLEIKNDAAYFRYWVTKHGAGETYRASWVDKGKEIRTGAGTSVSAWPEGVDVSTPPVDVLPGVDSRFREKARKAKGQTRIYTDADGTTMGIEVSSSAFVPGDGKPDLKISLTEGGHPKIDYIKSKYQGINIYVKRGDGAWVFLMTCNDPSCVDMSPLPAVGVSAAWTYKALYLFGGKEVGTVSKDTPITVLGIL